MSKKFNDDDYDDNFNDYRKVDGKRLDKNRNQIRQQRRIKQEDKDSFFDESTDE